MIAFLIHLSKVFRISISN